MMPRSIRVYIRIFSYLSLIIFLPQITAITPVIAQTEDPNPPPAGTTTPDMEYKPSTNADEMRDFAPPDAEVITTGTTVLEKADVPFDSNENTLLTFADDRVGVVVEEDTLNESVKIEFTEGLSKETSGLLTNGDEQFTFDPEPLLKFHIEIVGLWDFVGFGVKREA
jgi:hypothetical protein